MTAPATAEGSASAAVPDAEFVQIFTRHQRRLYLYILSQVPSPLAAEEILQDSNVVIWSKCRQFQPGTNFLAWITQIANYEILKHRTRRRRDRLQFSDEFIQHVAEEAVERSDELERRLFAHYKSIGHDLTERRWLKGFNPVYTLPGGKK